MTTMRDHLRALDGHPDSRRKVTTRQKLVELVRATQHAALQDILIYGSVQPETTRRILMPDKFNAQCFVFGSNLRGAHGKGAALYARTHFGAVPGVGKGPTGSAYALPTKDADLKSLTLMAVKQHVNDFITHAMRNADTQFMVTAVGTGLAGFTAEQIAPLFTAATTLENVYLPEAFTKVLRLPDTYKRMSYTINQRFA